MEKSKISLKQLSGFESKTVICSDALSVSLRTLLGAQGSFSTEQVYRCCSVADVLIVNGPDQVSLVEKMIEHLKVLQSEHDGKELKFKNLVERVATKEKLKQQKKQQIEKENKKKEHEFTRKRTALDVFDETDDFVAQEDVNEI